MDHGAEMMTRGDERGTFVGGGLDFFVVSCVYRIGWVDAVSASFLLVGVDVRLFLGLFFARTWRSRQVCLLMTGTSCN